MKNLSLLPLLSALFLLAGCATLERTFDDLYDGDPRMTEVKADIDTLKEKLAPLKADLKTRLLTRLGILREEAEMLGDLTKSEFATKLAEMREQLATAKALIEAAK